MALSILVRQTSPALSQPSVSNVFLLAQSTTGSPIGGRFGEKSLQVVLFSQQMGFRTESKDRRSGEANFFPEPFGEQQNGQATRM